MNRTIRIHESGAAGFERLLFTELAAASARLLELSAKKEPASYGEARDWVVVLCDVIAQFTTADEAADFWADKAAPYVPDLGEIPADTPEGRQILKDHAPHDPRAAIPHCVHGVPFVDHCGHCSPPDEGG